MKKIVIPILIVTCLLTACRKNIETRPAYNLDVSLNANFEDDEVKVYIDDQVLFNGAVSTDPEFTMAKSISTTATQGNHIIKVIVNSETVALEQFNQNTTLFVRVWYNKADKKISFSYASYN